MDRHLVIDRYLQGTLPNGEVSDFEERLVWDQALMDELDLAEKLRDGLRASAVQPRYSVESGSLMSRIAGLMAVPQFAAAASFMLAVIATTGVLLNPFTASTSFVGNQATLTEIVPLYAVRGDTAVPVVVNADAWTVLLVDAPATFPSYRVSITPEVPDATPVWMQEGLSPTYPESVAIGMPGSILTAGNYTLVLEGMQVTAAGDTVYEHIQSISFETTISP